MKISSTIRNTDTLELDTIEVETDVYDLGYADLRERVPEGWQMLNVGVDR